MSPGASPARARRARYRRVRNEILRWLLEPLTWCLGVLSWSGAQAVGRAIGRLLWRLGGRDRGRTLDHLAIAFPGRPAAELERTGRASFLAHGMNLAETLHLLGHAPEKALRHLDDDGIVDINDLLQVLTHWT